MKNRNIAIGSLLFLVVISIILFVVTRLNTQRNSTQTNQLLPKPTVVHSEQDPNTSKLPTLFDVLNKEQQGEKLTTPIKIRLDNYISDTGWGSLMTSPFHDVSLSLPFDTADLVRYNDPLTDTITAGDPYKLYMMISLKKSINNIQNKDIFIKEQLDNAVLLNSNNGKKMLSKKTGETNGMPYYELKVNVSVGDLYSIMIFSPRTIVNIGLTGSLVTEELKQAIISSVVSEK